MEQPPCPGSASLPWLPPARQVSSTSTAQTAFFPKKDWSPTPGFLGWGWPKAWARSLCLGPGYPSVFLPVSLLLAQIRDGLDQAVFYTQCSLHWSPFLVPNSPFCVLISLFWAQISHFWGIQLTKILVWEAVPWQNFVLPGSAAVFHLPHSFSYCPGQLSDRDEDRKDFTYLM